MTNKTQTGLLLLMFGASLAGCDGTGSPMTAPSPMAFPAARPEGLSGVTLFGVISETMPAGLAPISDVLLHCGACGGVDGHAWARTDDNGYYSFSGDLGAGGGIWLSSGPTILLVAKEGYYDPAGKPGDSGIDSIREVTINGDTRYDIQLVRR